MDPRWLALMKWCEDNPFSTIERLEIVAGKPNLLVIKQQLSNTAIGFVKIKFKPEQNIFTKK
jgi:hypothetical protein